MDAYLVSKTSPTQRDDKTSSALSALQNFVVLVGTGKSAPVSNEISADEQKNLVGLLQKYHLSYLFAKLGADYNLLNSIRNDIQYNAESAKQRGRIFAAEMVEILDLFRLRQIPCSPFKGPFLSAMLYNDSYARDASDIDILIEPHQAAQVDRLLRDRGYKQDGFEYFYDGNAPECPDFPLQTTSRRGLAGYGRTVDDVPVFIEIHTSVRYLSRSGQTAILMRRKPYDLDGFKALGPDYDYGLLLFFMDKYKDLEHSDFFGLRDIMDIYCCINLLPKEIWAKTIKLAEDYDCLERICDVVSAVTDSGLQLPISADSFWSTGAPVSLPSPAKFPYLNWDILLSPNMKGAWHVGRQHRARRYLENGPFLTVAGEPESLAPDQENPIENELGIDLRCRIHLVHDRMAVEIIYPAGALDFIGSHALRVSLSRPDGGDPYPGLGYVAVFDRAGTVTLRHLSGWGLGPPDSVTDGSCAAMLEHEGGNMLQLLMASPSAEGWTKSLPIVLEFSIRRSYYAFPDNAGFAFYTAGSKGPLVIRAE